MNEEGEEVAANFAIAFSRPPAVAPAVAIAGRECQTHDGIEVVVEAAEILASGAFSEFMAPTRMFEGAQQQRLHARGEDRVASVDGELAVAQLVGEADLPEIGMSLPRTVEIGAPAGRAVALHHFGHHGGGAARADEVVGCGRHFL